MLTSLTTQNWEDPVSGYWLMWLACLRLRLRLGLRSRLGFFGGGFASFAGVGLASSFFSAGFASAFFSAAGFGALAAGAAGFSSSVFFFATRWSFGSIRFFKYAGTIPAAFSSS